MTETSFLTVCKDKTNLTAMQINLLQRIKMVLPFIADMSMSNIGLYVHAKDKDKFVILEHVNPHTAYTPFKNNMRGTVCAIREEPLIERSMRTGKSIGGKREWSWGKSVRMQTEPIKDSAGNTIAVISFELPANINDIEGYSYLYRTACCLLVYAHRELDSAMFSPLSPNDGIIIGDKNNRIVFANSAARRIYNILGVINLIGCHLFEHQLSCRIIKETVTNGRSYEKELTTDTLIIIRKDIPVKMGGNLLARIIIVSDVTQVKKKDKELLIKATVIQEIHHRVKNNLQTIASLLRLQARRSNSQEVKSALKESINRILSISVVHEFLSQQQDEMIDVVRVAKNIMRLITKSMLSADFHLTTQFSGDTLLLPSQQASNLALIINELILNSVEHAFDGCDKGTIGLVIEKKPDLYTVIVYDNGPGFPANFDEHKISSLGLQIVRTLIENDLNGKLLLYTDNGAHAKITMARKMGE